MKRKILLIFVFVISLFMYIDDASAIVMWMQCGNSNGEMGQEAGWSNGTDEDYKYYNGIALINRYTEKDSQLINNINIGNKHVFFNINDFYSIHGPVYMANREGYRSSPYDGAICWYKEFNGTRPDFGEITRCDYNGTNDDYFYSYEQFNGGYCPKELYDTTGTLLDWGTNGAIKGDFVVGVGKTEPKNHVELDGYKVAFYSSDFNKYNSVSRTSNEWTEEKKTKWVIETYDSNGRYGFLFFLPRTSETASEDSVFNFIYAKENKFSADIDSNDVFLPDEMTYDMVLTDLLNINMKAGDSNDILEINDSGEVSFSRDYVDPVQVTQLLRISKLGKNYFKIATEESALLANIPSFVDGHLNSNNLHRFQADSGEKLVWQEIKDWAENVKSGLPTDSKLSKFSCPNDNVSSDYCDILEVAKDVSEAVENGRNYNLTDFSGKDVTDISGILNTVENAYNDLAEESKRKISYPLYEINNDNVERRAQETTTVILESCMDYLFNKTLHKKDVYKTLTDTSYKKVFGANLPSVIGVFSDAVSKQMGIALGGAYADVDFLNSNKILKDSIIYLSKYLAYIKKNYYDSISEEQLKRLNEILDKYLAFARSEFGIEIVIDCDTLLGEDFIERISKYVNIIRLAVPIILIGFGIYDFVSAVFANDDSKMKKAQQRFIMRVLIAVLFFLLPIFIKLILSIANKAWSFISPSGCNL